MKFTKFVKGLLVVICVLSMTGCAASENDDSKNTNNNTANISDSQKPDSTGSNPKNNDEKNETEGADTLDDTDGDNLIRSSNLQGSVTEFSDNGCKINPIINNEDKNEAVMVVDNTENNIAISYESDCVFQEAIINQRTGKARISDASVSDVKEQTSLLIYGNFEDTYHLTAEKIIIVDFE